MGNTQNRPEGGCSSTTTAAAASNERGDEESSLGFFTCRICVEPTTPANMFINSNICNHPFCSECISMYVQTKVVDDYAAHIPCPDLDCDQILDPCIVRHIIPPKVFDKWCDNLCRFAVLGLNTCYCPYPGCSVLVANECRGILKKTTCPNCKMLFCFNCSVAWHAGHKCSQVHSQNDEKFLNLAEEKGWKGCPTCGHYVDRIGGCNRVRCRCGSEFCHVCGSKEERCDCNNIFYLAFLIRMLPIYILVPGGLVMCLNWLQG